MIHIDSFSGSVADLKNTKYNKGRTEENVLKCLAKDPRVSTWDMSENPWLCRIIKSLDDKGLIIEEKAGYPWHIFRPIEDPSATKQMEIKEEVIELRRTLKNAYSHIQYQDYNDSLSSIIESLALLAVIEGEIKRSEDPNRTKCEIGYPECHRNWNKNAKCFYGSCDESTTKQSD